MKYEKAEMIYDCVRHRDVIVFDINTKLVPNKVYRRVVSEFPNLHKLLVQLSINNQLKIGSSLVVDMAGYTFAILVTQHTPYGKDRDDGDAINRSTMQALTHLFKRDLKKTFTSGILNRGHSNWEVLANFIRNRSNEWLIYTE